MHINTYLNNKQIRANSAFYYPQQYFIVNGEAITEKEMNIKYPIITVKVEMGDKLKGENPDGRKTFMK
jgi:hypothetical protein